MLGSITPLGERGRGSRWWLTVTAYLVGSTLGGVAFGGGLGLIASSFASRTPVAARLAVLAVAVPAGLLVDLGAFGLRLPTVRRQVDEGWRAGYRGWVWGLGFGLQLGAGVVTVVTTSTVYSAWLAAGLSDQAHQLLAPHALRCGCACVVINLFFDHCSVKIVGAEA